MEVKGPYYSQKKNGTLPLFLVEGEGVSIFGLRLLGPDTEIYAEGFDAFAGKSEVYRKENYLKLYKQNMHRIPASVGIKVIANNFNISNSEVYGWTYAGISLESNARNAIVSHNYIHHNQRFGLGYGVVLKNGSSSLIKANLFNYNRHSVAGTGEEDISVEISYNKFLEDNNTTWAIDMHGGKDREDGTNIAGRRLIIHHNTIRLKGKALGIVIRGVPSEEALIYNNLLIYIDKIQKSNLTTPTKKDSINNHVKGIEQRYGKGRMTVFNNIVN